MRAEVERMRKDAEAHADEDRRRKELIEARNTGDNAAYTAEKVLKDLGEKVPAEMQTPGEERTQACAAVLNSEDPETIRKATEDLNQVLQQVGAAAYQQSGTCRRRPRGPARSWPDQEQPPGGDEDVVDGEFRNA